MIALALLLLQAPPSPLHFQARLSNAAGVPLAGPVTLSLSIYDVPAGGAPLWSESSIVTPVTGVVTLALGSTTPIPATLFDGAARYLALRVGTDAEMTPRRAIVSVPFAARAGKASSVEANAVTTAQLVDDAVTGAKIANATITAANLAANSVTAAKIASGAVGTSEIAGGAVTLDKLASSLSGSVAGPALKVVNSAPGVTAILGEATATTTSGIGVHGSHYGGGWGVYGDSVSGTGVRGEVTGTTGGVGVYGSNDATGGIGVWGSVAGSGATVGVRGASSSTSGIGVEGLMGSALGSGIGVRGRTIAGAGTGVLGVCDAITGINYALRGEHHSDLGAAVLGRCNSTLGTATGVSGIVNAPNGTGVQGTAMSTAALPAHGVLGITYGSGNSSGAYGGAFATSGAAHGVIGSTKSPSGYGLWSIGSSGTTGQKNFIQPHPADPSLEIRFASLEGNESGTYFRGSARLEKGIAVIEVPAEFRLVSEATGISAVATPVGAPALLWIESKDLQRIVVRGDRDASFDYVVNGVRRGFAAHRAIHPNQSFVPEERGVPFGTQYPDAYRRILVENGILNPDFTPNEETAARLGWSLR